MRPSALRHAVRKRCGQVRQHDHTEGFERNPVSCWHTCAVISAKVVSSEDLGTHTLFIAEVTDAMKLNDHSPLTYADYQSRVKPKAEPKQEERPIIGWRCKICKFGL